jgi:hypothetical protein
MPNGLWSTVVVASSSSSAPIIRTDASNARGTLVPATSSSPLTRTCPFPIPVTCVDVNRTCGCSSTFKKSADRRCLSRARDAGFDARGVDRQLDLRTGRTNDVHAVEPAETAANGVQAPEVLDLELDLVRAGSAVHHSTVVCVWVTVLLISSPSSLDRSEHPGGGCHVAAAPRVVHCRAPLLAVRPAAPS